MVGVVMYFCSAARNSPACKGKSLQCLRKCRFSYIDTSRALSARRHLTAAFGYSARTPQRPSRLHLGCQTHQTWCALPDIFRAAPRRRSPVARTRFKPLIYLNGFGAGACGGLASKSKYLVQMNKPPKVAAGVVQKMHSGRWL